MKDFHAAILDVGLVPLDLLESHIHDWISETLSSDAPSFNHGCTFVLCLSVVFYVRSTYCFNY